MKKIILSVAVISTFILSSCGGSEVCGCAETALSMMKEAKEANGDMEKLTAIQEKYKSDIEACEKLDEGKTDEEKKAMEAEMEKCDAYIEMKELMK